MRERSRHAPGSTGQHGDTQLQRSNAGLTQQARGRLLRWVGALLACAVLLLVCAELDSPALVSLSPRLAFALAFALVSLEIVGVSYVAPALPASLVACAVGLSALAMWGLAGEEPTAWPAAGLSFVLLFGGSLLGASIGARIERAGHLLAVAAISALADLWSALDTGGPTARLVAQVMHEREKLSPFVLPFPLWGTGNVEPLIGAGDVVFVALYLAAFARHGLPVRRAAGALMLGFVTGVLLLLTLERSVPLLPLLGASVVLAHRDARTLPAKEAYTVLTVVVVLLAFLATRLGE